ncbi:hypothetical protein H0H93_002214, partial [Arthromyces matolae]
VLSGTSISRVKSKKSLVSKHTAGVALARLMELLADEEADEDRIPDSGTSISRVKSKKSLVSKHTAGVALARLMELLADEEADEDRIPDDGELDGSGDE